MRAKIVLLMIVSLLLRLDAGKFQKWRKHSVYVPAMFVLGDSSVDCGDNSPFNTLFQPNDSLYPCNASDSTLLHSLLGKKIGLPYIFPFNRNNGSISIIRTGLNFGSSKATIMSHRQSHQSLNHQIRQSFETIQLLQLQLGLQTATSIVEKSLFFVSFGREDYIDLISSIEEYSNFNGDKFGRLLVDRVGASLKDLVGEGARNIVVVGVGPLGCTPRIAWLWRNLMGGLDEGGCIEGINELIEEYNGLLERKVAEMNDEMGDRTHIVFCDVYQGFMDIIDDPREYGFEDVKNACCGSGWYRGMGGCHSMELACVSETTHVWWDFYNPTKTVNSLLADSAWSGKPLSGICRPYTIRELVLKSPSLIT